MRDALSDETTHLSFTIAAGARQRSHLRSLVPAESDDHILFFQIQDSPNLEDQAPFILSPRTRVIQLFPKHWVFVTSYN
jgi:hypothetical protein